MIMPRGQQLLLPVNPAFIAVSLLIGLAINLVPLGRWVWLPDLLMVLIVFWGVHQPLRTGMGVAFALGLCMDVGQSALLGQHALVEYRRVPSLTAGYVVSRAGAEKLIASRMPFGRPIDVDLRHWWENGLRIRGVVPALISLDDTSQQSSIGAKVEERSLASKWRKFCHKAAYTFNNLRHGRP